MTDRDATTLPDASDTEPCGPPTLPTGAPLPPPIVALAESYEDCTEDDDRYRRVVDPAGPYAEEISVAHAVSACMLFAAFLLGWAGRFVADTIQLTLRALWGGTTGRVPTVDNFCDVGAQLWWAQCGAAPEHVTGCVVAIRRRGLYVIEIEGIEGGQRINGKRAIKRVGRVVTWDEPMGRWTLPDGRWLRGVRDA